MHNSNPYLETKSYGFRCIILFLKIQDLYSMQLEAIVDHKEFFLMSLWGSQGL